MKNQQNARTLSDLKISYCLSSKKQGLLTILYSLLTLSKTERNKATNTSEQRVRVTRRKRRIEASTGQSFFSSVTKSGETSRTVAPLPQITPWPICEGNHSAVKCHKILNASPVDRYDIFLSKGLCFRCTKLSHLSRNCPSKSTCGECRKRHHTLLHRNEPTGKDGKPQAKEKLDQNKPQERKD